MANPASNIDIYIIVLPPKDICELLVKDALIK